MGFKLQLVSPRLSRNDSELTQAPEADLPRGVLKGNPFAFHAWWVRTSRR